MVVVGLFFAAILIPITISAILNNRVATEARAKENAALFIAENDIEAKRFTCAGDSDGDGYGTCTIVTTGGEKIQLQCPSNYYDVKISGAKQCKEVLTTINLVENKN